MTHNLNTTIDKIALQEFDMNYNQLGENEKQWCHDEMVNNPCLLYTSPSPRDRQKSRMPSSA